MSERVSKPTGKCPLCGKPAVVEFRPFCSKRCADLDLFHWFKGDYAIPACEDDAEEEKSSEGD